MNVCICRRVSNREITCHVQGRVHFDAIQFEQSVALQCGHCKDRARGLVKGSEAQSQSCVSPKVVKIPEHAAWPGLRLAA